MKRSLLGFIAVSAAVVSLGIAASSQAATFQVGDVVAADNNGTVQWYRSDGTFVQTLDTTLGGFTTGMAFDASHNLLVTNFSNNNITRFDNTGAILGSNPFVTNDASSHNESIVFDKAGNFYVGQADGTHNIIKWDGTGTTSTSFTVATQSRGSDWVDLASDQHTIYYTSEGTQIKRFDTSTSTQLADLTSSLTGGTAYALRILGNGNVLVADTTDIELVDGSTGNVLAHYGGSLAGAGGFFALNLDSDGTSFWTGSFSNDALYKLRISDGALEQTIQVDKTSGNLFGVAVVGEITQGTSQVPEPNTLLLVGSGILGVGGFGFFGKKKLLA